MDNWAAMHLRPWDNIRWGLYSYLFARRHPVGAPGQSSHAAGAPSGICTMGECPLEPAPDLRLDGCTCSAAGCASGTNRAFMHTQVWACLAMQATLLYWIVLSGCPTSSIFWAHQSSTHPTIIAQRGMACPSPLQHLKPRWPNSHQPATPNRQVYTLDATVEKKFQFPPPSRRQWTQ